MPLPSSARRPRSPLPPVAPTPHRHQPPQHRARHRWHPPLTRRRRRRQPWRRRQLLWRRRFRPRRNRPPHLRRRPRSCLLRPWPRYLRLPRRRCPSRRAPASTSPTVLPPGPRAPHRCGGGSPATEQSWTATRTASPANSSTFVLPVLPRLPLRRLVVPGVSGVTPDAWVAISGWVPLSPSVPDVDTALPPNQATQSPCRRQRPHLSVSRHIRATNARYSFRTNRSRRVRLGRARTIGAEAAAHVVEAACERTSL